MLGEQYPKAATLKDGRNVVIRPLTRNDFDQLYSFFQALPEEDRLFLRHDVTDPEPHTRGRIALRTWNTSLAYDTFRVWKVLGAK